MKDQTIHKFTVRLGDYSKRLELEGEYTNAELVDTAKQMIEKFVSGLERIEEKVNQKKRFDSLR